MMDTTAALMFEHGLRGDATFISLPAGIAAMPPARFGVYTLAGCLPWTAALAILGYAGAPTGTTSKTPSAVPATSSPRRPHSLLPSRSSPRSVDVAATPPNSAPPTLPDELSTAVMVSAHVDHIVR